MSRGKSVAIVGYDAVGKGIHQLFLEAVPYDPPLGIGTRAEGTSACSRFRSKRSSPGDRQTFGSRTNSCLQT